MFQNINESAIDMNDYHKEEKKQKTKKDIFSNIFAVKNIPIYIVTLMLSMVSISDGLSPFSLSMLGACISNSIPVLGVVIVSIIGNLVKFGATESLAYLLTALVMTFSMLIIRPKYNEEDNNEKISLAKNLFISTLVIQLARVGMSGFTIYDILSIIAFAIIVVVFYKIFVNAIGALQDLEQNKAFSIEEVLATSLMISISVSAFGDLSVYGFSIRNILSIFIVLLLGWKNGVLVGTTAGVTIGVTLGVITSSDPLMVAAYAISGMIAGILNKFGKIGVIIGFILGNVVLAYIANGYTVELIHFKEILIASIGLLAVPKNIRLDIQNFIPNMNFLPVTSDRALNKSKETAEKLNTVSETINELAKSYIENESLQDKDKLEENELLNNKEVFINELLDNLNGYEDNMLYDDLSKVDGKIVDEIFKALVDKQEINRQDFITIFAKCNSYIVGFDDDKVSEYLETNIEQMIRVINTSYKISKTNFVWKKRIEENNKNLNTQLSGVSKAISNIADSIQKEIEIEESYSKEKKEILELLRKKDIEIQEISINRNQRFLVEVYMEKSNNTDTEYIEKILSEILKEKIVLNVEASIGNRLNFISDDKYIMAIGNAENTKSQSDISGDSTLTIRLKDGKYLVAISDGMGSGKEAKQSSEKALKMLENLLLSGFDKKTSVDLINSSLINQEKEIFATLDVAIIDLYQGNIEFIKNGACPTYIKNKNKVQIIKSDSLPVGILNNSTLQLFDRDITSGDIVVMCSDGILDSNVEYKNKELWVKYLLEDMETVNTRKISDLILTEAIDNNFGIAKDDMTVIAFKFQEK